MRCTLLIHDSFIVIILHSLIDALLNFDFLRGKRLKISVKFKMSKGEKIIVIRDTSFDLSSGDVIYGEFSLFMDSCGVYGFEWFPNSEYDPKILAENNVPQHVTVSFQYIAHIIRKENAFGTFSIKITLEESSRLPWFSFQKKSCFLLHHIFEFLVFKKAVVEAKMSDIHYRKYQVAHTLRSENNIFGYVPNHTLDPHQLVTIAEHNKILTKLNYQAIFDSPERVTLEEFHEKLKQNKIQEAYSDICTRGLDEKARPHIWPIILGMYPPDSSEQQIEECLQQKLAQYRQIKRKWNSITKEQFELSHQLRDILQVSENDVRRNDRTREEFAGDDNPNLDVLRYVMRCYAIYNRDCGYVQGIGDIISVFIVLFIRKWEKGEKENTAVFFDGKRRSSDETESYIFWAFTCFMNMTQQDRIFGDLNVGQNFVLSMASEIAFIIHTPLKKLITESEVSNISFHFQSILLLYKRDFKEPDLFRVWDSIISSPKPYAFPRFISAAILILMFPKLLVHSDGSLCEAMDVTGGFLENVNIERILRLTFSISKYVDELPVNEKNSLLQPIPHSTTDLKYKPKMLKLLP